MSKTSEALEGSAKKNWKHA